MRYCFSKVFEILNFNFIKKVEIEILILLDLKLFLISLLNTIDIFFLFILFLTY